MLRLLIFICTMTSTLECFHSVDHNKDIPHSPDIVNVSCFFPLTSKETLWVRDIVTFVSLNLENSHEKTLKQKHNRLQHPENGNRNANSNKTPSHYKLLMLNKGSSKFSKHENKMVIALKENNTDICCISEANIDTADPKEITFKNFNFEDKCPKGLTTARVSLAIRKELDMKESRNMKMMIPWKSGSE